MTRPGFIKHWRELEPEEQVRPPVMDEPFGYVAEFAAATGIAHLRCAHIRLPAGVRAYPPTALRDSECFAFVLEGTPDLWLDGKTYRLREGDCVCLHARTGLGHAILNNTKDDVRLFILAEGMLRTAKAVHPLDPAANENLRAMGALWSDAPERVLGSHDGLTDARRGGRPPKGAVTRIKPDCVSHWRDALKKKPGHYPGSDEPLAQDAPIGRKARFSRLGVRVQLLAPGRRTSWPHAERDEAEFVYVVSGQVDAWNDGHIAQMNAGDFIGWEAGTGITHVILNNSPMEAILIVGGEASRARNQFWYPFHPRQNKAVGELYWADHPVPQLGEHDGLPDAMRKKPKKKDKKKAGKI